MSIVTLKPTGPLLRERRKQKGLSMRAIAAAMSLSPPYLSDLERGNRLWSPLLVRRYRAALKAVSRQPVVKKTRHPWRRTLK